MGKYGLPKMGTIQTKKGKYGSIKRGRERVGIGGICL